MLSLPTRALGKTGIEVTTLGVGCAWLGRRADGSADEETGLAAILAALDSGVRLIDTASLYVDCTSERARHLPARSSSRPRCATCATSATPPGSPAAASKPA